MATLTYLEASENILDRFGDDPDFYSHEIKIGEVITLANALNRSLMPYTSKLEGTAYNLYNGLQEWLSGVPRQDRAYNLRAYLWQLSQTLVEFGLGGKPIDPNDDLPF